MRCRLLVARDPLTSAFADAMRTLAEDGYGAFVEISPHPVLTTSINECLREAGGSGVVVPSLRRKEDERATMLRSLGSLYVNGASPAWDALYRRDVTVPLSFYPFERERHWFDPDHGTASQRIGEADVNPLLGQRLPGAQPLWETRLDVPALGWIGEHLVQQQVVMPGAAYVVMALAAARRIGPNGTVVLYNLAFQRPLILREGKPRAQISLDRNGGSFGIYSLADGKSGWTRHAEGRIGIGAISSPRPLELAAIADRLGPPWDVDDFYATVSSRGLVYGPTFRGINWLRTAGDEALATIGPIEGLVADPDTIHPGLLDAAFQVLIAIANTLLPDDTRTFMPVSIDEVRLYRPTGGRFHVYCRLDSLLSLTAKARLRSSMMRAKC